MIYIFTGGSKNINPVYIKILKKEINTIVYYLIFLTNFLFLGHILAATRTGL
jgi:hypothetical protein